MWVAQVGRGGLPHLGLACGAVLCLLLLEGALPADLFAALQLQPQLSDLLEEHPTEKLQFWSIAATFQGTTHHCVHLHGFNLT